MSNPQTLSAFQIKVKTFTNLELVFKPLLALPTLKGVLEIKEEAWFLEEIDSETKPEEVLWDSSLDSIAKAVLIVGKGSLISKLLLTG